MPGQVVKTDLFRLSIPTDLLSSLEEDHICTDWADVMRTLAAAFCDGDLVLTAMLIDA